MQFRLYSALTELFLLWSWSFEELDVAKSRKSDSVIEEEGLYALFWQFRVDDEGICEEEGVFGGYPCAGVDHQSIVLPDESSEHVLILC